MLTVTIHFNIKINEAKKKIEQYCHLKLERFVNVCLYITNLNDNDTANIAMIYYFY